MKVRVLAGFVAVAMLAGVGSASAQSTTTFGVKAGPNFSTVSGNPGGTGSINDVKTKIDVSFGGEVTVPINEMVAFQPEFLYQRVGAKIVDLEDAVPFEFKLNVDMVTIPLLLRVGRASEERGVYFLAGPTIDFITKAKFTTDDERAGEDNEDDIKDEVNTTTFGLSFGVGVTIKKFFVEYRYSFGLQDLQKEPDPVDPDNKIKNNSSVILFGYQFGGN